MSTIELELSEDEKAQLLASLAAGFSESSVSIDTPRKTVSVKKQQNIFVGPPKPVNRDGMGRYIPQPGGKPLSIFDEPTPGPGEFSPEYKLVEKRYPEYSMGEGVISRQKRKQTPAPSKYDLRQDMAWGRCKTITIKKRFASKTQYSGPGPADYVMPRTMLGGRGFKIAARPKSGVIHGFVSSLTRVPDPTVPGPYYKPCNDEWLQKPKTFGIKHHLVKMKKTAPGPADYFPKIENTGPKWGMRRKFKESKTEIIPGPASYKLEPLVHPNKGFSMGIKHATIKDKNPTPGPNMYQRDKKKLSDPGFTLQYRWFDREPELLPGPGHYKWTKDPTLRSPPAFSIKPPWPQRDLVGSSPGPGDYDLSAPPLDKGRTIGLRLQPDMTAHPSPADYYAEKYDERRRKNGPSYSMGGRFEKFLRDEDRVGPCSYFVKDNCVVKPAKSFGMRLNTRIVSAGPGPAPSAVVDSGQKDRCGKCECDRAVSVKGRHTPNKYSGIGNLRRVEDPPKNFQGAPLLG
ncbi:hypothetical protein RRG08_003866 [Elysia crispata]|uniref:Uncharacterized protein n=1 Tax=Elysia crispata TaxID=231223 RepID=A0AAE0ZEA2_9GAST|nr:hypothetical protein RRG08_003866 [Elysia crispata]